MPLMVLLCVRWQRRSHHADLIELRPEKQLMNNLELFFVNGRLIINPPHFFFKCYFPGIVPQSHCELSPTLTSLLNRTREGGAVWLGRLGGGSSLGQVPSIDTDNDTTNNKKYKKRHFQSISAEIDSLLSRVNLGATETGPQAARQPIRTGGEVLKQGAVAWLCFFYLLFSSPSFL